MIAKILFTKRMNNVQHELANQLNLGIIEIPMITVELLKNPNLITEFTLWWDFSQRANLIFTSVNAVKSVVNLMDVIGIDRSEARWKVFATSGATQRSIQTKFKNIELVEIGKNAVELVEKIKSRKIQEISFFSGNLRRPTIPEKLKEIGILLREIEVYKTLKTPKRISEDFDGIAFFSPSAVQSYLSVNEPIKRAICFAIGTTTGEELVDNGVANVVTCKKPKIEYMLEVISSFFKNKINKEKAIFLEK